MVTRTVEDNDEDIINFVVENRRKGGGKNIKSLVDRVPILYFVSSSYPDRADLASRMNGSLATQDCPLFVLDDDDDVVSYFRF